ncbi:MAG: XdhC/CoxI family protein [Deferrisomatales bacterium]
MDALTRSVELLESGDTFVLATALTGAGRTKLIIRRDGAMEGTTGSTHLDAELTARALRVLQEGQSRTEEVLGRRVFFDLLTGDAHLLLCGAESIAPALARCCREAGFAVAVVDDRRSLASPARFPGCRLIHAPLRDALARLPLGPNAYVVVVARGDAHDVECLSEALLRKAAYAGIIGRPRRVDLALETLAQQGGPREWLAQVFTPVGLPIGAESGGELALAVAAELVCVRRRGATVARALRAAGGGAP